MKRKTKSKSKAVALVPVRGSDGQMVEVKVGSVVVTRQLNPDRRREYAEMQERLEEKFNDPVYAAAYSEYHAALAKALREFMAKITGRKREKLTHGIQDQA